MSQPLRLLIVEDSEDDVLLLQHTLRRGGYQISCQVVETPDTMRAALARQNWDVITSDHSMPGFNAPAALALANELCPDVPFLIVSGEIDLNLAVSLMRDGAKDYIQKTELARLVPAIERELREAELRRERQRVDTALESRLVALARPLDRPETIVFSDLFDLETIQRLQDEFATAAEVASIITRPDGTPITRPSNFCRLCEHIIRKTGLGQTNCYRSDAEIGRYHPGGPIIQPCMSGGLWDAGAGISVGGRHIANWLIGQVRDETQTEEQMRAYARAIGADEEAVIEAFHQVPAMSPQRFEHVAKLLYTIANQLSNMAYQNAQQARLIIEGRLAEQALRVSEQNFREIFNSTSEAIFIDDAQTGKMIDVNDSMLRLYGYESKEEVLSGSIGDLSANAPPFGDERAQELVMKAIHEGPQVFDWLAKRRDGSTFWTEVSLCKSQIGGQDRVLAVVRDISERKRAEAEREALLEIMQGLAETRDLHEILSIIHRAIGRVIYARNFFVVFFNKSTGLFEEVYSVDEYDPPSPPSRLEKSITAYIFHTAKPLIMTQALFNELEARGEVEMVGTNSASWMGAPLITPDGAIGVIVVQDYEAPDRYQKRDRDFLAFIGSQVALAIERKRAEEAQLANSDLLNLFMHHSPIYSYIKEVTPTRSVVLHASENYEEMVGIPGSEMVGWAMEELFPPEFAAKITADDWEVVSRGKVLHLEEELNGRSYTTIKFPIVQHGRTLLAGYTIDITQRKQAGEEARRAKAELEERVAERTAQLTAANQELEAFAYSVSHDLRAPLRSLEGFSAALLEDCAGQLDEQGRHYVERIRAAAKRMEQLVGDLLKLSRLIQVDFSRQQVDLTALANTIAAELAAQMPRRQVKFEIASNMSAHADENLVKIALQNLLDNACKFTGRREKALIEVGELEQNGKTVYFVRDNGAGFQMELAERLFVPFQRLHSEQEFPGVGIGLATVQRIVHRHGGQIWAEGVVDAGATFYFTLG